MALDKMVQDFFVELLVASKVLACNTIKIVQCRGNVRNI